ncbi:MAG: glycine cleavage system protein GcvH [Candidatus Marinimicrobia bacterium]|nr:glycine cleavage system protein GcvH [Candidatus Neomarinimicrobiota bacterium]
MNIPKNLKYSDTHEWVRVDGDVATVGVTDFAQSELGDIVFVELPQKGLKVGQDDACGTIEAVKTVSDINAPVSGEIIDVNPDLEDEPTLINTDCYKGGWILKIRMSDTSDLEVLMDGEAYEEFAS